MTSPLEDSRVPAGFSGILRDAGFRGYFLSVTAGTGGYAIFAISVVWLAYRISGGLVLAGIVLAVETGIYSLSFLAGPVVDRVKDLRTVLIVGYPIQAVFAGAIGLLALENALSPTGLIALLVPLSVAWDFTWTATNAIPPRLVSSDQLFRATGFLGAVGGSIDLVGYAAGAALILSVGPAGGMVLYALLNAGAAFFAVTFRVPVAGAAGGFASGFREGWAHFFSKRDPNLLPLVMFSAAEAFFSAAPALLITLFASRLFSAPALSYAILYTSFAVGAIVGSLALARLNPRRRLAALLCGGAVAEGALIAVSVVVAGSLPLSAAVWLAVGTVDVTAYTSIMVYLQATTPEPLVGRTVANAYLFRGSSRSIGAAVVGSLAAFLVPEALGGVVALGFVVVGIGSLALVPAIRRIRF